MYFRIRSRIQGRPFRWPAVTTTVSFSSSSSSTRTYIPYLVVSVVAVVDSSKQFNAPVPSGHPSRTPDDARRPRCRRRRQRRDVPAATDERFQKRQRDIPVEFHSVCSRVVAFLPHTTTGGLSSACSRSISTNLSVTGLQGSGEGPPHTAVSSPSSLATVPH